jgi:voltage-gated potassium channel
MPTVEGLRRIVEESDTRLGLAFDISIQVLILASIIIFSIETLPSNDSSTIEILGFLELFCIVIFSLEYLLRITVAKEKANFIFSFWGMIDLLAILPFYLVTFGFTFDLIMLRSFRLLRLVKILKFGRYNQSLLRISLALKIGKEDLLLALAATFIMLLVASFGIYQFENPAQPEQFGSVFESLWWALSTLTTVGYGDVFPITAGGKVFTGIILMIGLGIVALPAGIIASSLSEARDQLDSDNED